MQTRDHISRRSKTSVNTPKSLIEAVGIGIKEMLYQAFNGWTPIGKGTLNIFCWVLAAFAAGITQRRFTKTFYWRR
jgi:hypothetical protein